MKDNVALQYTNGFYQVATEGLTQYQRSITTLGTTGMGFNHSLMILVLVRRITRNSHVVRKYGVQKWRMLCRRQRMGITLGFLKQDNPKLYLPRLRAFDTTLKDQGINPGTSADLTVSARSVGSI